MKYEHYKMGGRWGQYTCRCSAETATPEGERGTDLACRCAFPVSVISCRTNSCFIHVWKSSLCLWRGRELQTYTKCECLRKKKHKYQDCCVEVFCRDQMPRAATAADRALAPPLCCGCSLGLDRSPLGGRRRLDAAPRGHSGRASALVGEGVLQYSN